MATVVATADVVVDKSTCAAPSSDVLTNCIPIAALLGVLIPAMQLIGRVALLLLLLLLQASPVLLRLLLRVNEELDSCSTHSCSRMLVNAFTSSVS